MHENCDIKMINTRVETRLGYSGQPGRVLSGSSGSDLVYTISGSDPDFVLNHMK